MRRGRGRGMRGARCCAALRPSSRRLDGRRTRVGDAALSASLVRSADLLRGVRWRPMHENDIAVVAELESQAHVAPWTSGNFRDALAAGYGTTVGQLGGTIVAYGVLMRAPGETQLLNPPA